MFDYGTLQCRECLGTEIDIYAYLNLQNSRAGRRVNAIVDTGAVMTCVPEWVINRLGASTYSFVQVRLANGELRDVQTVLVHIKVANYDIPERVEVAALNISYALIGRDILNQYRVTLDGPLETWSIESI